MMDLRTEVMIAFSKVPHPGDGGLTSCNCEECQWEVGRFRGKRWNRLSRNDLGAADAGLNFAMLTPPAFHYFLPGLLLLILDDPETGGYLLDHVISRITALDRDESDQKAAERVVKRLTVRQRQILVAIIRQAENSTPPAPVTLSAIANLKNGTVTTFGQSSMERWLAEQFGGRSGDPPESEG